MDTQEKISQWVLDNFGEGELNDPSWNIKDLAKFIDNN